MLIYAIPYGGPVAMVWGVSTSGSQCTLRLIRELILCIYRQWALCSVFIMCIACTVAELGSAAPTAGGFYYWTYRYASPRMRNVLSWIVGCQSASLYLSAHYSSVDIDISTMTYAVATTAVAWASAVSILAGASIGSDFSYLPTTAQTL